jgi:Thiolase, N-terminal domain
MERAVRVGGVGMVSSAGPGRCDTYDVIGEAAVQEALLDAWIPPHRVQRAFARYVYGDPTSGQAVLDRFGLSGIPVVNVNNDGARGSSTLWLASRAVASGAADCVLAVGFEEMRPSSPQVVGPGARQKCSPPTRGAAAAVLCSDGFAHRHGINRRVVIRAPEPATDRSGPFSGQYMMTLVGYDMTRTAARQVPAAAGVGAEHVTVMELRDRDGPTGLARCVELVLQLRERAGVRPAEMAGRRATTA